MRSPLLDPRPDDVVRYVRTFATGDRVEITRRVRRVAVGDGLPGIVSYFAESRDLGPVWGSSSLDGWRREMVELGAEVVTVAGGEGG